MIEVISFDPETGFSVAEAGISLAEILDFAVPRGFFLPVTTGTKYVSLGGAIANDIHGKNHHVAGCFGNHIIEFELVRSTAQSVYVQRRRMRTGLPRQSAGSGLPALSLGYAPVNAYRLAVH